VTTIEPADLADLDALLELWLDLAAGQQAHGSTIDPAANEDTVRESLAQHVLTDGVLLARRVDAVVGFVMFGPDDAGFQRERTRGVVRNVYVVPGVRGEGVGTELMDAAERRLAEEGFEEVVLEAMADNEAARRFYRERGYEPHRVTLSKPLGSDTTTR
jgi:ribosomal protein S18 acetylase RimI-like enzyme